MKQKWRPGDLFAIPLANGSEMIGQVLGHEASALNSVGCALFDEQVHRQSIESPPVERILSVVLTTRDLLDSGAWTVFRNAPVTIPRDQIPFESLRSSGFVGAKIVGSANVTKFASACFGLDPWDGWHDPEYLDRLLFGGRQRPPQAVYRKSPS